MNSTFKNLHLCFFGVDFGLEQRFVVVSIGFGLMLARFIELLRVVLIERVEVLRRGGDVLGKDDPQKEDKRPKDSELQ